MVEIIRPLKMCFTKGLTCVTSVWYVALYNLINLLTYSGLGDDVVLSEWASDLHELLDRYGGVRYPSGRENARIPRDVISRDTSEHAKRLCSSIINWCTDFINRN